MESLPIKGTRFGGTGVRSAQKTHLTEFPYRMECGTLNTVGVAGLYAGTKWVLENGLEKIHAQEMELWKRLKAGVEKIENITLYCAEDPANRNAVLSMNIDKFDSGDVGTMLDVDYNIACRTGLQCAPLVHEGIGTIDIHGTVRLSIGPFNTEAHIDAAIEALEDIASIPR